MDICSTSERLEFRLLSILRYPGGKKRISPDLRLLFNLVVRSLHLYYPGEDREETVRLGGPKFLLEPFAGGAVVGLTLLNSNVVERLILVEKDDRVAAFWKTALRDSHFADHVEKFRCTRKNVEHVLDNPDRDLPFWTLVANRCSFNGKLNGGISKDVSYNWNGKVHAEALRRIRQLSDRIEFIEGDGVKLLRDHANDLDASSFVDAPYFEKGKTLYREWKVDPSEVFEALASWRGFWLMTYDCVPEIKQLLKRHGFTYREFLTQSNNGKVTKELLMRSRHLPYDPKERPRWKQAVKARTPSRV